MDAASHLSSSLASDGEAEQSGLLCVALHLELGKAGGVALNGLRHLPVYGVQLHGSHHTVLLNWEGIIHEYKIQHGGQQTGPSNQRAW